MKSDMNLMQTPDELRDIHGRQDYYWYLRSPQFRTALSEPIANLIVERGCKSVLDVGCGEGVLRDCLPESVAYLGIDGSQAAVDKAVTLGRPVILGRIEEPETNCAGLFDCLVFSGILEVLVKPERRSNLIGNYILARKPKLLVICDLVRLDTSSLETMLGKPLELWSVDIDLAGIPQVKNHRKVIAWEVPQ